MECLAWWGQRQLLLQDHLQWVWPSGLGTCARPVSVDLPPHPAPWLCPCPPPQVLGGGKAAPSAESLAAAASPRLGAFKRTSTYMQQPIFNSYHKCVSRRRGLRVLCLLLECAYRSMPRDRRQCWHARGKHRFVLASTGHTPVTLAAILLMLPLNSPLACTQPSQ